MSMSSPGTDPPGPPARVAYILLAEDDPAHAEAIRRALVGADPAVAVAVAGTLADFKRRTEADPPRLAIVDLNLPDGRALDILTAPPEDGAFPVLIMTSYGTEQMAVAALKAGALDYVVKTPEAFAGMPRTVERVLREWELRRERKAADIRIRHLNDVLHTLRGIGQLILLERNSERLIQQACELMVTGRSYGGALIALMNADGRPGFSAKAGFDAAGEALSRDLAAGRWPDRFRQVRDQGDVLVALIPQSERTRCTIAGAVPCTHRMYVPLAHQGDVHGFLAVTAAHAVADDPEERSLFAQMAGDLGYALHNLGARDTIAAGEAARKALEAQLQQAQKMEAVGRVVGGVAHDFNNLLSIILGYTEVVVDELNADHPHREPLEEIRDAAVRARNLTRQLLAFSRKQVLEMDLVDLNHLVRGFEKLLRRVIGEDIALTLNLVETPVMVEADTSQLEQVLMNLAVNARDAMPDGGRLTIETGRQRLTERHSMLKPGLPPGEYALLRVGDTGSGMDRETLERLFEPFFTTKSRDKGTGLGLATCYGIIKQHGGHIRVSSEPGRGATFTALLPLAGNGVQPFATETKQGVPAGGSATILVVEDDPKVRQMACTLLAERGGYTVLTAEDAARALALAASHPHPIDLLLTDVIMPDLKGPEVFEAVRAHHPRIRVLFMSGYPDEVITRQGVLQEGVRFIAKPFAVADLLHKVQQVLQ